MDAETHRTINRYLYSQTDTHLSEDRPTPIPCRQQDQVNKQLVRLQHMRPRPPLVMAESREPGHKFHHKFRSPRYAPPPCKPSIHVCTVIVPHMSKLSHRYCFDFLLLLFSSGCHFTTVPKDSLPFIPFQPCTPHRAGGTHCRPCEGRTGPVVSTARPMHTARGQLCPVQARCTLHGALAPCTPHGCTHCKP